MPLDMQQIIREVLTNALPSADGGSENGGKSSSSSGGGLSGVKGLAAGAGAAALAPLLIKNATKLAKGLGVDSLEDLVKSPGDALGGAASNLTDKVASGAKDQAKGALDDAGGPGGILKDAAKGMLPFGGGDGGGAGKNSAQGVGKGRRMPIQQSVDIGLPIETVYNQWTQFEEWPTFMHRVKRVTQEDDCTVSFATKIWGKTKEFTANIDTQRPDERIKWRVSQGMTHTGVVTFHELAPNLTRVMLSFDVDPGSLIEKFARGARHVKRAARADLHRFKALIEMAEHETGAWRGVIEDGELVEEHDPSYDEQREYSDIEDLTGQDEESDEQDEEPGEQDEGEANEDEDRGEAKTARAPRSQRQARTSSRSRQSRNGKDDGEEEKEHSSRRRRQSAAATKSRGSGRSARAGNGGSRGGSQRSRAKSSSSSRSGGSSSSSSGSSSRSSRGSSNGQSGSRGRSRSQRSGS